MDLQLESGRLIRHATEQDIISQIDGEEFAILSVEPDTYIQFAEQKEPPYEYVLEYQDGHTKAHFQAIDGPITWERIVSAFLKYLRGDESWHSDFRWDRLELN
jgi:hypothetical protein